MAKRKRRSSVLHRKYAAEAFDRWVRQTEAASQGSQKLSETLMHRLWGRVDKYSEKDMNLRLQQEIIEHRVDEINRDRFDSADAILQTLYRIRDSFDSDSTQWAYVDDRIYEYIENRVETAPLKSYAGRVRNMAEAEEMLNSLAEHDIHITDRRLQQNYVTSLYKMGQSDLAEYIQRMPTRTFMTAYALVGKESANLTFRYKKRPDSVYEEVDDRLIELDDTEFSSRWIMALKMTGALTKSSRAKKYIPKWHYQGEK